MSIFEDGCQLYSINTVILKQLLYCHEQVETNNDVIEHFGLNDPVIKSPICNYCETDGRVSQVSMHRMKSN